MKPLLFVDSVCNIPYDHETLTAQAIGGSEATVIRVAEALGKSWPVTVLQHNRRVPFTYGRTTYTGLTPHALQGDWQGIVVVRNPHLAIDLKLKNPNTPVWVWLHDQVSPGALRFLKDIEDNGIGIIVVSEYLKQLLHECIKIDPYLSTPEIIRIYNPIDDELLPNQSTYQPNQLAFVSSPHKGLDYTLKVFKLLREKHPQFELHVTNPGYFKPDFKQFEAPGVKYLGCLHHAENIKVIRNSLCIFFLNHVFPETFGIVLAESNAVGTPVLTHPIGAAPEVLQNPEQLINIYDHEAVIEKVVQWQHNRPVVSCSDQFRLSTITKQWKDVLL